MFFRYSEICLERCDSNSGFGYLTKIQKKIFEKKIGKTTHCPSIVTLALLLFLTIQTDDGIVESIFGLTEIDHEKDRGKVLTPEIDREIERVKVPIPRKEAK